MNIIEEIFYLKYVVVKAKSLPIVKNHFFCEKKLKNKNISIRRVKIS
jgi:hypothetical protein